MPTDTPVALVNAVLRDAGVRPDAPPVGEDDLESMSGGVDASTYLVHGSTADVVVKLDGTGLQAEARALRAWRPHSDRVPEVLGAGRVARGDGEDPLSYVVLEVLRSESGGVVRTATEVLEDAPDTAGGMGEALGTELRRLHEAVDPDGFGNLGDAPGAERTYDSWGAYLSDYLAVHHDYLTALGVSEQQLRRTHEVIRDTRFVDRPRFLHGDVSVRNLAVYGDDPVVVGLFDPNPISGDPSWDLAPLANKVVLGEELRRRGGAPEQLEADAAVWAGVRRTYGDIHEDRMMTAQLVQAVLQAETRHDRDRDDDHEPVDDRELEVADDFVRDLVDRLSG